MRSRGLGDLGNKDDGVCYGCNWKIVKSGRFCTRTCLLLSLVLNSDRLLGGHPSKSCYSKDLQDGPQIMALGNGPKQD